MLQTYVFLRNPKEAGVGALVSIAISALTTGYTSSMIAFDKDVDVQGRKNQPKFYGYIPDNHALRGRCFVLMSLISSCHNLSRSVGCALLAASSSGKTTLLYAVVGEIVAYLAYKIARRDFLYWLEIKGNFEVFVALPFRVVVKVIVDFSGCLHMRHP